MQENAAIFIDKIQDRAVLDTLRWVLERLPWDCAIYRLDRPLHVDSSAAGDRRLDARGHDGEADFDEARDGYRVTIRRALPWEARLYVICHELAHHELGHSPARAPRPAAAADVAGESQASMPISCPLTAYQSQIVQHIIAEREAAADAQAAAWLQSWGYRVIDEENAPQSAEM